MTGCSASTRTSKIEPEEKKSLRVRPRVTFDTGRCSSSIHRSLDAFIQTSVPPARTNSSNARTPCWPSPPSYLGGTEPTPKPFIRLPEPSDGRTMTSYRSRRSSACTSAVLKFENEKPCSSSSQRVHPSSILGFQGR